MMRKGNLFSASEQGHAVRLICMETLGVCVGASVRHSFGFAHKRMSIQLFKWPHTTSKLIASP
jgi:hypothetical protein